MARVLVMEDDRRTSVEIAAALGDYGFDVECAFNGRNGLLRATAEKYDAIVLDHMLPGDLDGLGVLATFAHDPDPDTGTDPQRAVGRRRTRARAPGRRRRLPDKAVRSGRADRPARGADPAPLDAAARDDFAGRGI